MGSGQLDGEWEPLQPGTQGRYISAIVRVEGKVRLDLPGALDEKLHRWVLRKGFRRYDLPPVGYAKRRHREASLAPYVQGLPAGDEHLNPWAYLQEHHDRGGSFEHLLKVVQHEEHPAFADVFQQRRLNGSTTFFFQIECVRQGWQYGVRINNGSQVHEVSAVFELLEQAGCYLQGEARLADARRAGEGKQACFRVQQKMARSLYFALSSDQSGECCR